jgi:hypothetical protein
MGTSPASGPSGHINAPEAAEAGHMHGYHLGELLSKRKFSKVHFIAHSAGTWVARSAATYLRSMNKDVQIQVTLLDPFIPGQLAPNTSLTKDKINALADLESIKLENYYSVSANVDERFEAERATAQWFVEWDKLPYKIRLRVDHTDISKNINLMTGPSVAFNQISGQVDDKVFYDLHAGPIVFYADSILGRLQKPTTQDEDLSDLEYQAWQNEAIGWKNSLFYQESLPSGVRLSPDANLAHNQTTIQQESLVNEFYQVPYARSNLSPGEYGGTSVEFVQKARPELTYGWAEAGNAATRARQEG